MAAEWLAELRKQLQAGESFYPEMNAQLAAAFETATGEALTRFQLLPPSEGRFQLQQDGDVFSVAGSLLNIDVVFPVRIAWMQRDSAYRFWWLELPSDQIKNELAARRNIEFETEFKFQICIRDPVWPHIDLTLHGEPDFDVHQAELIIRQCAGALEQAGSEGVVHRIGDMEKLPGNRYRVHIDFGSAGPKFLTRLLKRLEACHVRKVTLDSWPNSRAL